MLRPVDVVAGGLLASGLLLVYVEPLAAMVRQWNASPMYSYAFTVPVISAYLVWERRDEFRRHAARSTTLTAIPVLAVALGMLAIGEAAAVQIVQQLSFVVALAGVVLLVFGWPYLRVALPALGYLLFMVPIWDVFTEPLHWPFQLNSARLGVAMMQSIGIPVYREDTILQLPNVVIEVARACSGVNYLIAVLALALPLAFLRLRSPSRRIVLIGAAVIIAAMANSLRVTLICILAYYEVGSPLHGPFHVLHGLFVAGVGYVALFLGLLILERGQVAAGERRGGTVHPISWCPHEAVVLAGVFWLIAVFPVIPSAAPVAWTRPINTLEKRMGVWYPDPIVGSSTAPTEAWSMADHHFSRRFRTAEGLEAIVDVWHFERQQQNQEVVNFKAAGLHRAASSRSVKLADGRELPLNLLEWHDRNELGVFWYDISGSAEAHQYFAKAKSIWSVIRWRRNDAAVVMVRMAGRPDEPGRLSALDNVAAEVAAALQPLWPTGT